MEIDIPFGAKDSELKGWKYTIPEGYTAEIKDGEIIVKSAESDDERLRKMLIARVRTAEELNEELREWIIAYLEKKEQQEVNCDFYNKELSDIVSAELYKYSGPNSIKSPWALDSTGVQYPLYFANLGAKWQKKQKSGEWNKEDEKIRKALISLVDENAYTYKSFAGVDLYSMLAWLEKQKDNKFAPRVLSCSAAWFEDGEERQKEQKPKNILTNDDSLQTAYLKGQTDVLEDPEAYGLQKEQKPVEFNLWKDTKKELPKPDSLILVQDFDVIRSFYYEGDGYLDKANGIKLSIYQKWCYQSDVKEIKPVEWSKATINGEPIPTENQSVDIPLAEWSEEDKSYLQDAISCVHHIYIEYSHNKEFYKYLNHNTQDIIKWLKSLRPQPHKEIYQAAKHDLAIKFMNYLDENRPEDKMGLSNIECEDIDKAFKENDWAKIVRYVEKYSPSWKPSEGQMKVFFKATPVNLMPEELLIYQSLYNDIEKLM